MSRDEPRADAVPTSWPHAHDANVDRKRLDRVWAAPPGLYGWVTTTDHKEVGKRFIYTAFIFFLLGGVLAALMRFQLAQPENEFLSPDRYNQIFTMHGTTMMFLFAVPIMEAFGIYLIPLMVGTRNLAGWILDPQGIKPGAKMPPTDLDPDDLQALLAYLETLR